MSDAEKKKLLIVDDNTAFLELIAAALGEEFTILQAANGEEGLGLARAEKPDLILLDVMMPKVSGVEMLRELQADEETRGIPVIVLTASKLDPSTHTLIEREPNVKTFLRKPCGIQVLRGKIHSVLGETR